MRGLLLLVTAACLCNIPIGANANDELVEEYFRTIDRFRTRHIHHLEKAIKEAPNRSPEAAEYTSILKEIKQSFLVPYILSKLDIRFGSPWLESKVGSVGEVFSVVKIRQRIDDESALVEVRVFSGVWNISTRARSYTSASVRILGMEGSEELMLLRGLNIPNLVDGDSFKTDRIFVVSGTTTYETAIGGSKTVLVIEPVGESTEKKIADRRAALQDARNQESPGDQNTSTDGDKDERVWTDASGKFSVKASFAGAAFGKVKLRKEDGSVIEVDLDKLSPEDQEYIKSLRK